MKTLRQLSVSALLMLVLALPTLAGDMHSPVVAPPPPPTTTAQQDATTTEGATGDLASLTEITLRLLQNMLALF